MVCGSNCVLPMLHWAHREHLAFVVVVLLQPRCLVLLSLPPAVVGSCPLLHLSLLPSRCSLFVLPCCNCPAPLTPAPSCHIGNFELDLRRCGVSPGRPGKIRLLDPTLEYVDSIPFSQSCPSCLHMINKAVIFLDDNSLLARFAYP